MDYLFSSIYYYFYILFYTIKIYIRIVIVHINNTEFLITKKLVLIYKNYKIK